MSAHAPLAASSPSSSDIQAANRSASASKQSGASASKPNLHLLAGKALNLLLYLNFCVLVGVGLLLYFKLPPGRGLGHREALGFTRHDWGDFHAWTSFAFIALIVAHLVLHWKWLATIAAKRRPTWLWAGVLAGVAIIVGFLLIPISFP